MRSLTLSIAALSLAAASCAGPLYAPCDGQWQCADGLRCVNTGGEQGICTRSCSIVKKRAGYPDAFADDKYFEDGAGQSDTIGDAQCSDGNVDITSEDTGNASQKIGVVPTGTTIVGVCRVSPEQQASGEIDPDSELSGVCVPF